MIKRFLDTMEKGPFAPLVHERGIAVGVSGGPDSIALAHLLSCWSQVKKGPHIHVMSVDHGLRPEAAAEVAFVGEIVSSWPGVAHHALHWDGEKPAQKIQETARLMRYQLMERCCGGLGVKHLFLAHHQDDQAETVLFRLAKGSGLDGLAGMRCEQRRGKVMLMRPFLDFSKDEILSYCASENLPYIDDPSNRKEMFARVRLRASREVLEKEGLSAKRLSITARRLERAAQALEDMAEKCYVESLFYCNPNRIVFKSDVLLSQSEEIVLRVLMRGIQTLSDQGEHGPRMERLEALCDALMQGRLGKARTLGGVIFRVNEDELILEREQRK